MKWCSRAIALLLILQLVYGSLATPRAMAQGKTSIPDVPFAVCGGFNDVVETDYFCRTLEIMASAGHISGYMDGGFHPNADISRGEFSKILVNHFGLAIINPNVATFADVPRGSTFYTYIETAVRDGIMSGYAGDPNYWNTCLNPARFETAGLRYFRPCNQVTRGQMAKMVSSAAHFNDSVSGRTPSFSDVPTTHTFFTWIERLVMHEANGPFPPNVTNPPTCASSTQPCFFPNRNAPRADVASHILHTKLTMIKRYAKVFGTKQGQYAGVGAEVTTPNPTVPSGRWVAAPVGVTNRWNGKFIESGPIKDCTTTCDGYRHPYGSWASWYGGRADIHSTIYLDAEGGYYYSSEYIGGTGTQWRSYFCNDIDECTVMITSGDLGSTTLPYVAIGVESNNLDQRVGFISISRADVLSGGGYWNPWCYDPKLPPWKTAYPPLNLNGYIGPCNANNWAVSY